MPQPPALYDIEIERDLRIPMRDGVTLSADLYRPQGEGKWPVLVNRDAYLQWEIPKDSYKTYWAEFFSRRGYAYLNNSVRGAFLSEGDFCPMLTDVDDGYDVIEWAARQSWSNGKVGMYGCSYGGFVQYLAAAAHPPSLKACYPIFASSTKHIVFQNGVHRLREHRGWAFYMTTAFYCEWGEDNPDLFRRLMALPIETQEADPEMLALVKANEDVVEWLYHLPLKELPALAVRAPWYFEHLRHPQGDPWWDQMDARTMLGEIDVPMLHIGGWYDLYLAGTLAHYLGILGHGRAHARANQRLIVGPWFHSDAPDSPPLFEGGPEAFMGLPETALTWFDHWLRGAQNQVINGPNVRLFLMGENRWLEMEAWPPAEAVYTPLYLQRGSGPSATSLNNGGLSFELPGAGSMPDSYTYDPDDPILSLGVHPTEPIGIYQEGLEGRMLTYTSEPLAEPLVIIGPVRATIYASSSAPDTDWRVLLCDVEPDGRSRKVCDGILRARYRNSFAQEELMEPGQIYCFEIDLVATANSFLAGHRIRVDVTSSDFPWLDRNLNTGGPFGEEASGQVAINTIYHDTAHASHVVLPVMPR